MRVALLILLAVLACACVHAENTYRFTFRQIFGTDVIVLRSNSTSAVIELPSGEYRVECVVYFEGMIATVVVSVDGETLEFTYSGAHESTEVRTSGRVNMTLQAVSAFGYVRVYGNSTLVFTQIVRAKTSDILPLIAIAILVVGPLIQIARRLRSAA